MKWEAALWCGVAAAAPALAGWAWPRLRPRLGRWADYAEDLAPWLHGIVPAYMALITGAVLGRDAGLYGQSAGAWAASLTACAAGLAAAAIAMRLRPPTLEPPMASSVALDEFRWGLYRAAGILWTGDFTAGVLIGLGLTLAEWVAARRPWQQPLRSDSRCWLPSLRAMFSASLFFLTRNLWLTMAVQVGLALVARRQASPAPERGAAPADKPPSLESVTPGEERPPR